MGNKKRIVCYGDSNTWGFDIRTQQRFNDEERWTAILQEKLGCDYIVQEEGLCGRTTVFEDPLHEGLNGLYHFSTILESHNPIDLLIIMLGTNDCKQRYSASPENIADGLDRLIDKAKILSVWRKESKILIVAPVHIREGCYSAMFAGEMGAGCVEKSVKLPSLYQKKAVQKQCLFWDCNEKIIANDIDFMHFSHQGSVIFANEIAKIIIQNC